MWSKSFKAMFWDITLLEASPGMVWPHIGSIVDCLYAWFLLANIIPLRVAIPLGSGANSHPLVGLDCFDPLYCIPMKQPPYSDVKLIPQSGQSMTISYDDHSNSHFNKHIWHRENHLYPAQLRWQVPARQPFAAGSTSSYRPCFGRAGMPSWTQQVPWDALGFFTWKKQSHQKRFRIEQRQCFFLSGWPRNPMNDHHLSQTCNFAIRLILWQT